MVSKPRRLLITPFLLLVAISLSGCNSWIYNYYFGDGYVPKKTEGAEKAPEQLAIDGMRKFRAKDYEEALKDFQQLKERYPYNKYAILAELKVADCQYNLARYPEATIAYEEFVRLHPRNEVTPYAIYQTGMGHFLSFNSADRDPAETKLAMETFKRLIQGAPGSPYAGKAGKQLQECKKRIAFHEFTVARFYYRRGVYWAAKPRLEKLAKEYTGEMRDMRCDRDVDHMLVVCNKHVEKDRPGPGLMTRLGF
jgi:outer membrane protein assembly factor BamD